MWECIQYTIACKIVYNFGLSECTRVKTKPKNLFNPTALRKTKIVNSFGLSECSSIKTKPENLFNPIALGKTKIVYNFGLSECNRVKTNPCLSKWCRVLSVGSQTA